MSEQREALAAIVRVHRSWADPGDGCMGCEWRPDNRDYAGPKFCAHLTDVILRDWLPGALADERVVEAAANGISDVKPYPPSVIDEATAALSAAVTALTEDDA